MAALKIALSVAALLWPAAACADPVDRWSAEIANASRRFGIPQAWIRRVMRAESGGRTRLRGQPIVSRAGAMGLMQLMPATWQEMRHSLGLGPDAHDPADNILAGTAYLRSMYERFGYPGLFAAYNAGPGRYADYLKGLQPLPSETRAYVSAIVSDTPQRPSSLSPSESGLFAASTGAAATDAAASRRLPPGNLFVPLSATPGQ